MEWLKVSENKPENGKQYIVENLNGVEVHATWMQRGDYAIWKLDVGYLHPGDVTRYKEAGL